MKSIDFKNIEHHEPHESLKPFVKFYLRLVFEAPDFPLWIPADRRNQILLLKQGEVQLSAESSDYVQPKICFRTCFDRPLEVTFKKGLIEVIAVDFTPIGLHHLFNIDMEFHSNQLLEATNYKDAFSNVDDSNVKLKLDQALKNQLLQSSSQYTSEIAKVINFAEKEGGKYDRLAIAKFAGLHYKTFYRHFKKFTGIAPKKYFNIIQFENTLVEIIKNQEFDNMSLLVQSGYYDQSHFIKAIQKFTGNSPKYIKNLDYSWVQFLLESNLYH